MPDGRVLIAGSKPHYFYRFSGTEFHTELRIEAFSPEYLLSEKASIRPIILELPEMISYGSGFDVVMTTELPVVGIIEINITSAPFATHYFSQGQRLVKLAVSSAILDGLGSYRVNGEYQAKNQDMSELELWRDYLNVKAKTTAEKKGYEVQSGHKRVNYTFTFKHRRDVQRRAISNCRLLHSFVSIGIIDQRCFLKIRGNKKKKKKKGGNKQEVSSTLLEVMVKNDISPNGDKIVKGRGNLSKLSNDLRKLHKEAIAIRNLQAHLYINKDSKLIMDSVENVIHIVARYRKRMKDYPFSWRSNKMLDRNYWLYRNLHDKSRKNLRKSPKEGFVFRDSHRIPHVKGSDNCSTRGRLSWATSGPLVDTRMVLERGHAIDPSTNLPNENEAKIWMDFVNFDKETPDSISVDEEKKTIEVDHPIVSVIGNFAVNAFNNACEMHVKKGEHNNLHDSEFAICNYLKFGMSYHFYMTIEAIEEGNLGTYLAEVICNSSDGARTLCKFVLTDQEPLGTKALAVYYLSCLRSISKTVDGVGRDLQSEIASAELSRIRRLCDKTLEGLHQRLYQDTELLFPPDCSRTTKRG
ncbi:aldehyde oxidase GLOX [Tanacetum coccineum]